MISTKKWMPVRAKELATKAIDKIIDPSAPPEERAANDPAFRKTGGGFSCIEFGIVANV
jgi:hypothetical protein